MSKLLMGLSLLLLTSAAALADGKVMAPQPYEGSLEETAQEAIIIFHSGDGQQSAKEDLILKISVQADAELKEFAWIVPLPNPPKTAKADGKLFAELHRYCEARQAARQSKRHGKFGAAKAELGEEAPEVEVISREVVGSYQVDVVREQVAGTLNDWLKKEGYKTLDDAEDVLEFYRQKGYVFACVKVTAATLQQGTAADLHPLRFTFETGGIDGVFFPMRLTGLQQEPFDVNLYVFHRFWLNDRLNKFGFVNHGFHLKHRDWDTAKCVANGGKNWADPASDPYLRDLADTVPAVAELFRREYPGERFYLTNIQSFGMKPEDVRRSADDLWLFPYYTDRNKVPFDVRQGGAAAIGWPDQSEVLADATRDGDMQVGGYQFHIRQMLLPFLICLCGLIGLGFAYWKLYLRTGPTDGQIPDFFPEG